MKKYFLSGFFLKFKSKLSGFQRTQPELLGVPEHETARETMHGVLSISMILLSWV